MRMTKKSTTTTTTTTTPIIFILSTGADPTGSLQRFGAQMGHELSLKRAHVQLLDFRHADSP